MSDIDKKIEEIVSKQNEEEFIQKSRRKELDNFRKNFIDNYKHVNNLVKTTNKFIAGLNDIANKTPEEGYSYDEFCSETLEIARKEIINIDFTLLIMNKEVVDSYVKREMMRMPDFRKTHTPEQFQEHINNQIPKWIKQRATTFKNRELVEFHRKICTELVNNKLDEQQLSSSKIKNTIEEFVNTIFNPGSMEDIKFTVNQH